MTPSSTISSPAAGPEKSLPPLKSPAENKYAATRMPRLVGIIEGAKQQFGIMVNYPIESVTSVKKVEDGWHLLVTLIELGRIPSSSDVLAEYALSLDQAGEIVSYKQGRRFLRSQVGTDDGE